MLSTAIAYADSAADAILGVWHTSDNKGLVEIIKRDGHYFGKVLKLTRPNWPDDDPSGMGGKPRTDRKNPDPKLRDRPLVGIEFMHDFAYQGKNLWDNGKIYDPESGKTYKCKMILISTNSLEVHGYIGVPLFGRTVTWSR